MHQKGNNYFNKIFKAVRSDDVSLTEENARIKYKKITTNQNCPTVHWVYENLVEVKN